MPISTNAKDRSEAIKERDLVNEPILTATPSCAKAIKKESKLVDEDNAVDDLCDRVGQLLIDNVLRLIQHRIDAGPKVGELEKKVKTLEKENKSLQKENKSLYKESKFLQKENKSLYKENKSLAKDKRVLAQVHAGLRCPGCLKLVGVTNKKFAKGSSVIGHVLKCDDEVHRRYKSGAPI